MRESRESMVEGKMAQIENVAARYYDTYRDQMDALDTSVLAKVRGGLTSFDVYGLGKQLEQFDSYLQMCEEDGNVNQLGQIPKVAYDVITAVHGVSILPIIASVQPIDEERGNVYFKNIRSGSTKGSQTAGAVVVDPRTGVVTPSGYAGNFIDGEEASTTGATPGASYTFILDAFPVRASTVKITVEGSTVYCLDYNLGNGTLLGVGLSGVVNYLTGEITITFAVVPAANKKIYAQYQQNYELSTDLPLIESFFDSVGIFARIYALKGIIGMFQSYGMKKRFGLVAEEEVSKDLVQEINREIGGDLIRRLKAVALGLTEFDRKPPTNVSYFEHKQTYKDQKAKAESTLVGNAGRGTIALMIVGRDHAAVIETLPGWKKVFDGNSLGAHVYGTLDDVPVVRVTESALLGVDEGLCLWRGQNPFEAAAVYSPFMPLVMTSTLPMAPNPLMQMKAAAVWAGVEALVPQYVTKFNCKTTP